MLLIQTQKLQFNVINKYPAVIVLNNSQTSNTLGFRHTPRPSCWSPLACPLPQPHYRAWEQVTVLFRQWVCIPYFSINKFAVRVLTFLTAVPVGGHAGRTWILGLDMPLMYLWADSICNIFYALIKISHLHSHGLLETERRKSTFSSCELLTTRHILLLLLSLVHSFWLIPFGIYYAPVHTTNFATFYMTEKWTFMWVKLPYFTGSEIYPVECIYTWIMLRLKLVTTRRSSTQLSFSSSVTKERRRY